MCGCIARRATYEVPLRGGGAVRRARAQAALGERITAARDAGDSPSRETGGEAEFGTRATGRPHRIGYNAPRLRPRGGPDGEALRRRDKEGDGCKRKRGLPSAYCIHNCREASPFCQEKSANIDLRIQGDPEKETLTGESIDYNIDKIYRHFRSHKVASRYQQERSLAMGNSYRRRSGTPSSWSSRRTKRQDRVSKTFGTGGMRV